MNLESHAYADLFPMMSAEEMAALIADIAENGLRTPIVLYEGKILDGRNRHAACLRAGVDPAFTTYEGDDAGAFALAISLNVQRRDLTAAHRAMTAARAMEMVPERRGRPKKGENVPEEGTLFRSREALAGQFKVGKNAIQQAKAILAEAPDLAMQVDACALSLAAAYEQLQERREEARQRARDAEKVAHLREAVGSGEMTLDEAIEVAMKEEREAEAKKQAEAQARRIWFEEMRKILDGVDTWVGNRTDEYLAWFAAEGIPSDADVTADRVGSAIAQLTRVQSITLGGSNVGS